ncbi:hypothetical protein L5515_014519 [Caenorhabditis briggsae]|uniref:Phosphatidic acid phosphatase type 2/haloperoxidase domain-containing protein n=1 Tax=Caenorhabditis briggsae TaxID=6238 RepID=A0AAE9J7M0_CAEBR|nr:hypothetical protein L5515_014519 [Caenorhabditis briggsae]
MDVFRRSGNVVQINLLVAVANVILLYGFFFITDYAIKLRVLTFVGYSQVGYIVNELLVKFVNGFIGRLRPYFYVVCNPLPLKECQKFDPNIYIEDYHCQGNPEEVEEARKSFYSGHSTVTMYCAFWTVLYLQARLKPTIRNNVILSILQTLIFTVGLFICCSRISDNKHHWSDVLVGIIVGMPLATISAFWWGKLFKTSEVDVNNCEHKCFGKKKEFV